MSLDSYSPRFQSHLDEIVILIVFAEYPGPLGSIGAARVVPYQPPAIRGVGTVGGFQFVVEDQSGSRSLEELSAAVDGLVAKAAEQPRLRGVSHDRVVADYIAQTPLGRLEEPEDVADVVVFLCSDQARFMTGQGVNVTGGVYTT